VNTAMCSIVNAVMRRGLPFADASRRWHIQEAIPAEGTERTPLSQLDFAGRRSA